MVYSIGLMDQDLTDSSLRIILMEQELIIGQMVDNILVIGKIIRCMEKEFLLGVMEESIYI
jgi:hypothetical protein